MEPGAGHGLSRWVEAARRRWPEIELPAVRFAGHVAALGIAAGADHPHADDLYLACATSHGDPAAVAAFERELSPVARAAARRIDGSVDFVDEVVQATRERLLVARDGRPPRVAEYAGRGTLAAWVRVAAMRIAMNLLRERRRNVLVDDDAFFDAVRQGSDGERAALRSRYGQACADAVRAAFATLTARERNLLRLHHLHGLTLDELAPAMKVHRATVARWMERARGRLLEETRAGLRARLTALDAEVDSILRELQSRIDVTLSRLLAE
ncbi:MAG TPA: sigma-70 family RNA polymerase sigma factor [Kofleriaceae bacterium]|nr:sigma-70 family RNA polymerase sigma factor [Kofleriaceae bacterium]